MHQDFPVQAAYSVKLDQRSPQMALILNSIYAQPRTEISVYVQSVRYISITVVKRPAHLNLN
jgi:hypothetical protein